MRRSSFLPTTALASALLLGCSDQPVGTNPNPDATPPLMAAVSRVETPFFVFFGQAEPPIAAFLGVTAEEFPALCAGTLEPQLVANTVIVTHPTKQKGISEHILSMANELSVLVWPVDVEAGGSPCDFPDVQPFVGTVKAIYNDNEGQFFETAPGANAFVTKFVGTVTDQETGQRYHVQGAIRIVISPDGTFTVLPLPFLSLTPIGG